MAKIIPGIKFSPVSNAQFDAYMSAVLTCAETCPGILTYLPHTLKVFRRAVEAMRDMMARPTRWELTPKIAEADAQLNKAIRALRFMIKASRLSENEETRLAAETVYRMSGIGKVSVKEQYDLKLGRISIVLGILFEEYEEETRKAELMPFVMQLKERSECLRQLLGQRDETQGAAGPRTTTLLRRQTTKAYHKLVFDVNSTVNCIELGIVPLRQTEGETLSEPFGEFIDFMCGHIERYQREIIRPAASKAKKKKEEAEENGNGSEIEE